MTDFVIKTTSETNEFKVISFSAEWCSSCRKIKNDFNDFMSELDAKIIESKEIPKIEYKNMSPEYKYIPAFIIVDKNGLEKYIQTSDINVLKDFINNIFQEF